MRNRLLAASIAIAISGLIPLVANAGSCADMPCCHHPRGAVIQSDSNDCCLPAACAPEKEAVKNELAVSTQHSLRIDLTSAHAAAPASVAEQWLSPRPFSASPPPSTAERLSSLSLLRV